MPAPITLQDMVAEARMELNYRRNVFANAVRTGRMNKRDAERRFDVMEAILRHLEEERNAERDRERGEVDDQHSSQ